ncbi:MAG: porin family protein [Paludibacter sp.]
MKVPEKKSILFIPVFICCLSTTLMAQGNLLYVDQKPFHFGFSLGFNSMDFNVTPSLIDISGTVYDARVSILKPGFSVGIITDLRLNRYMNLRCTPTLHFGERQLNYAPSTGVDSTIIQSIPICVPFYLKFSSERNGNIRPYVIVGGGASIDLATNTENPVLLKPLDFYTEFGVGCDIYFSFFKLCPELKYSIGFNDIFVPLNSGRAGSITPEKQRFSNALSKLTSKMLTLTFNFE